MSRWKNLPASLMEIGKLSSLPIIPLQAIQGNNYDFTLQPEIILNRSNAHSNGEEKKNEDQSKVETHSQLFRREILPWELSFPAKRGHFLDNNKKKNWKRERSCHLSRLSFNFQLLETKNDESPGNRSNRTTWHLYLRPIPLACFGKSDPRLLVRA